MVKAVIFDLDGTLIDSLEDLYLTMNKVLVESGYPLISKKMVKHLIGNGAREFVRLSLPENERSEANIDRQMNIYVKKYNIYGQDNTKPFDGIIDMLKKLEKNNIKTAVLSNKPHSSTIAIVEKLFGDCNFDAILGQKDCFPPKPDIQSALYVTKLMGAIPPETVFIGDGDTDVLVANSGGFFQTSVLWGYRNEKELKGVGAKNFVKTPQEILDIFNL